MLGRQPLTRPSPPPSPAGGRRALLPPLFSSERGPKRPRHGYGEESSTFAAPTGLRGSVPPDSVLVVRSQATVCRLPQTWLERRLLPSDRKSTRLNSSH